MRPARRRGRPPRRAAGFAGEEARQSAVRRPRADRGCGARAREAGCMDGAARGPPPQARAPRMRMRARAAAVRVAAAVALAPALGLVAACARIEPPPGGPPDAVAPRLIATRPDSFAQLPGFKGDVEFRFD